MEMWKWIAFLLILVSIECIEGEVKEDSKESVTSIENYEYRSTLPYSARVVRGFYEETETYVGGQFKDNYIVVLVHDDITPQEMFEVSESMLDDLKKFVVGEWTSCTILFVDDPSLDINYGYYTMGVNFAKQRYMEEKYEETRKHIYGEFALSYSYDKDENQNIIFKGYNYRLSPPIDINHNTVGNFSYRGHIEPDPKKLNPIEPTTTT